MSFFRFPTAAVLALTIFFWGMAPTAHGHGGGHGGGGHGGGGFGGHAGFGFGGHPGFGFGGRGFGFGGFGFPGFGGFGFSGFGFGGLGFSGLGYGGFGFSGLGYGGLGFGGLGYGGLGYGGLGVGGYGFGGYGGFGNCGCMSGYPLYGGVAPVYGGGVAPANGGGTNLPMPNSVRSPSRYVDYYARNANPASPSVIASSASPTRYVDYYARTADSAADNKARLRVSLPADAVLWLNDQRMDRTGSERDFITPHLQKGETYAYQVKARWTQDGKSQEETIEVKVRANKTTAVSLGTSSLAKR